MIHISTEGDHSKDSVMVIRPNGKIVDGEIVESEKSNNKNLNIPSSTTPESISSTSGYQQKKRRSAIKYIF